MLLKLFKKRIPIVEEPAVHAISLWSGYYQMQVLRKLISLVDADMKPQVEETLLEMTKNAVRGNWHGLDVSCISDPEMMRYIMKKDQTLLEYVMKVKVSGSVILTSNLPNSSKFDRCLAK